MSDHNRSLTSGPALEVPPQATGPWRSLDQLADTPEFRRFVEAEFPAAADSLLAVDRRQFLQLMGASLALAGLSACTQQPDERIVPYVRAPENIVPGEPLYYATAMQQGSDAIGLLVESHMGRPTKAEGNPEHPASLGATDIFAQASVLGLYDPDRSRVVRSAGEIRPFSAFVAAGREVLDRLRGNRGAGLRIVTGTVISPTLIAQIQALLGDYPEARWLQWEPVNRDNVHSGARIAFGAVAEPCLQVKQAKVILALDADFLASGPQHLRHAREFASLRRSEGAQFNRLYVAEPTPSLTGSMADHRLPAAAAAIADLASAIAGRLGLAVSPPTTLSPGETAWVDAVAKDLKENRGHGLVIAGESQPAAVHALTHAINDQLSNGGKTVVYLPQVEEARPPQGQALAELAAEMAAGKVEALFILGSNPVLTAPADLDFAGALLKVGYRAHLGLYEDETAHLCHWHVPEAHYLEAWSDLRAYDGTLSVVQPLILPLYDGKSVHEVIAALSGQGPTSSHDIVRGHWRASNSGIDDAQFDRIWRRALHDGLVAGSASPVTGSVLGGHWREVIERELKPRSDATAMEIVFRPDPHIFDGRFANNAWLQELPKPNTRLVWDNAALISPQAATRLGLTNGDVVTIEHDGRTLEAPVWIQPGQAANSITVHLGYGRTRGGQNATGRGFDAYRLRTSAALWHAAIQEPRKAGRSYLLVSTQDHASLEGRDLLRVRSIGDREEHHGHHEERPESMYPDYKYEGHAWGMAIDLSSCIGCNACTIACQAENNIAIVGKDEVGNGREMHWIRVDRYFEGPPEDPEILHQPVPCMHCENAPCEIVCPANATMHSDEGLNEMVYNRCVGTRYCANNCPYKVRRFNFRLYSDWKTESLKLQRNPDVTVRSRGVMEKCTYCVQRINATRIQAKKEGRAIRDGEVVTACQQVCPTEAIVFGDINDPDSKVAQLKKEERNYGILTDLNTRPRTTYLAKLRNPNPELKDV